MCWKWRVDSSSDRFEMYRMVFGKWIGIGSGSWVLGLLVDVVVAWLDEGGWWSGEGEAEN